jgi:hypothetical protein
VSYLALIVKWKNKMTIIHVIAQTKMTYQLLILLQKQNKSVLFDMPNIKKYKKEQA